MIANRGLPEIEVLRQPNGNAELALTLLRCVGWLSRDDFSTRKGHAGPMIATPGAQMLGRHSFDYAIIPHAGGWQTAYREAYAFNAPLRAVSAPCHPGKLPPSASLIDISPASSLFSLSAIKAAEDRRGWIVRGCNLGDDPLEIRLTPWQPFGLVERVNLAEQSEATLSPANDGSVTVTARGREIVTLRFSN
jgi:alpha-mannosidase